MDKDRQISKLIIKVDSLAQRLEKAEKRIEELESVNTTLRLENTKLKEENTELKTRLHRNSNNSSKPSSSDGYKKKPAFPKAKNGKQGGRKGHKGCTLQQVEKPDKIVACNPDKCSCGHEFTKDTVIIW